MLIQETILCATGRSAANPSPGSITLHDFQTGATLASFKQTSAEQDCTAVVETKDGQGGFMLSAQSDKSVLNVYNFQKDQLSLKIVVPEKLTCVAVDKRGLYCGGGTNQGRIFLWEVSSGILFNAWDAHYRRVNVLRFTHDGAALISGSEDSGVSVWSLSSLLDNECQNDLPTPYCSFSDHTLPVTDIACGIGAFPSCRILTSSLDHSAKLFDLGSRSLLTTFLFPKPITRLVFEIAERIFFAASSDGSIHQIRLFRDREISGRRIGMEAIGGGGADAIRIDDQEGSGTKRLISVEHPVTSLAFSYTSACLLVGTATGSIHIYDIASHQLLRSISTHKGLPITHIQAMLKPPDLIGHVSLTMNVRGSTSARDATPPRPVVPFQRVRDAKAREFHEVLVVLPRHPNDYRDPTDYDEDEFRRDYDYFTRGVMLGNSALTTTTMQSRVTELESEVERLNDQINHTIGINDYMWETFGERYVSEMKAAKEKAAAEEQQQESGSQNIDVNMAS